MTIRTTRISMLLLGAVAIGACAGGERGGGSVATTVDSSRGYPLYRHSGSPQRWNAELVTTVGADTGGPFEFGAVTSVALDARGSLFVLDGGVRQLSAFDSLGEFVGRWGRRGRGPGEYVSPLSIATLHDTVALLDRGKIMLFAPGGGWVREWNVNPPTGAWDLLFYRTGSDVFWTQTAFVQGGDIRRVFIRHPSVGATDTIDARTPGVTRSPPISCDAGNGGFSFYPTPFGPAPFIRPFRSGNVAVAVSSEYRWWIIAPSGDTLRGIDREWVASPIPDAEWEAETEKFRAWRRGRGNPACTRNEFDRPAARPAIERLFVDDEGYLWVETYGTAGGAYEVFGEDGSLRATVHGLPPSGGVDPSVAAGRIAIYAPDSADIPRVQVYRIRKP